MVDSDDSSVDDPSIPGTDDAAEPRR
jgi:hypothetical protein